MHFFRMALAATGIFMLSHGADAAQRAGVAAGIVGPSHVSGAERQNMLPVTSGMDMLLNDRVQSEAASRLQILLLDETVLTIGPDSDLVIDKFVFDPAAQKGEMTASLVKGALRYISGNIARANPENVVIKTNTATIGVRGTALFVTDDPKSPGTQFIGLLGPGANNDGDLKAGGLTVSNSAGTTEVFRAGYGVFVSPGGAPGPAIQTPLRLVQHVQQQMTVTMPQSGPQSGPQSDSGENSRPAGGSEDVAGPGRAVAGAPAAGAPPAPPPGGANPPSAGTPPLPPVAPSNIAGGNLAVTRQLSAGVGDILGSLGVANSGGSTASQDMVAGSQENVPLRSAVTLESNPDSIVLTPATRTLTVSTSNALTGVATTTAVSPTLTTTTTIEPTRTATSTLSPTATTTVSPTLTTTTTVSPTLTTTTTLSPTVSSTAVLTPAATTTTLSPTVSSTAVLSPTATTTTLSPTVSSTTVLSPTATTTTLSPTVASTTLVPRTTTTLSPTVSSTTIAPRTATTLTRR